MFILYVQLRHVIKWSQLHVPAALPSEEGVSVPREWKVGFAPNPAWMLRRRGRIPPLPGTNHDSWVV